MLTGRKRVCLALLLIAALLLQGCGLMNRHWADSRRHTVISYAEQLAELLANCSEILYRECADRMQTRTSVFPLESDRIALAQNRRTVLRVFENDTLQTLFSDNVFREINVRSRSVDFIYSWDGFGSQENLIAVSCVRSGSITDLYGYDSDMTFRETNGGFLGTLEEGNDNTLFYTPLTESLYYIEVHY